MGCSASTDRAPEPAVQCASQHAVRTDKVNFKQATVVDLLGSEREENERVLLKWASAVFARLKDDDNRAVCLLGACLPMSRADVAVSDIL